MSTKKFIISWKIENFLLYPIDTRRSLISEVVTAKSLGNTAWFLELCIRKCQITTECCMDVFLGRNTDDSNLEELDIDFCFEIIRTDGYCFIISEYETAKFKRNSVSKSFIIVSATQLIENLTDDVIIIRCHLLSRMDSKISSAECIAWNKFNTDKYSYRIELKRPDSPTWSHVEDFNLSQSSYIKTTLTCSDQFLECAFDQPDNCSNSNISCKLSLLNGSNITVTKIYMKSWAYNVFNQKNDFVHRSSLYEETDMVKSDMFSLLFEFSIPNGTMSKGVEYSANNDELTIASSFTTFESELYNMLLSNIHSDMFLKIGNTYYYGHKCILSARSDFFRSRLLFDYDLPTPILDQQTIKPFLTFLYTNRAVGWDVETAMKLLVAARSYYVPSLTKQCSYFLTSKLTDENIHEIHRLAVPFGTEHLIKATYYYINRLR